MKKVMAIIAMFAMAISAKADISINWTAGAGFYNWNWDDAGSAGGTSLVDGDYINFGGGSAIAYLIWSSDANIDFNAGNLAGAFVGGNDQVLDTFNPVSNSPYGDYTNGPELYPGALSGGGAMVFLRIIDLSAPGPGVIAQYFDSNPLTTTAYNPNEPASQPLNHNATDTVNGNEMIAVVPEPSVLAFLAIGGLALAIRRRVQA